MSSKSMIPYEYKSDFSVNFPLDAYSGARYLQQEKIRSAPAPKSRDSLIHDRRNPYISYPNVPTTLVEM